VKLWVGVAIGLPSHQAAWILQFPQKPDYSYPRNWVFQPRFCLAALQKGRRKARMDFRGCHFYQIKGYLVAKWLSIDRWFKSHHAIGNFLSPYFVKKE